MVRAPKIDKNGVKRGAWSEEEDNKLREYVTQNGHWNWRQLPKYAGLSRCGKSCRLRWVNYLRPNIKIGNYTKEEDDLIIKLHNELGNKWSAIAKKLQGRSDNDIKNHWHSHLKNRAKGKLVMPMNDSRTETPQIKVNQDKKKPTPEASSGPSNSSTESTSWTSDYAANFDYSITSSSSLSSNCLDFDWVLNDSVASSESFAATIDGFWNGPLFKYDVYRPPLVTEYFSPPSPIVAEVLLWSYDQ